MPVRPVPVALLALGALGLAVAAASAVAPREPARSPTLDDIKPLAGTWVQVNEQGEPTDRVMSVVRVTSGGHAVIETEFPGTDHEMITMYYMEGGELHMMHYCAVGNRPHMKASFAEDGDIVFSCVADTGIACDRDFHMHGGRMKVLGADRMRSEWYAWSEGKNDHTAVFDCVRVASPAAK